MRMGRVDWKEFFRGKKWREFGKSDWVVLGLFGVLLLVIAMPTKENDAGELTGEPAGAFKDSGVIENGAEKNGEMAYGETLESYVADLEERMEKLLEQMDGVGEVRVMITVSDRGECIVEKDLNSAVTATTEEDAAGGKRLVSEETKEAATVYVECGSETYPYIQKEKLPTIEGVVVVAEGGGNAAVVSNISESVKALLPVEAHRIKVVKMGSKEE